MYFQCQGTAKKPKLGLDTLKLYEFKWIVVIFGLVSEGYKFLDR